MSDVSLVTNLIPTVNEGFTSTVGGSGVTAGGAIVPLTNVSGLVNGTVFVGIVEPGLTNQQTFTGTVDTAGSQITGVKWTRGTNTAHASGVTVVDYVTGTVINMMGKAFLTEHKQDGTHSSVILDKIYPVGSLYFNATNSSNPSSLLGFGTWIAFGGGRVPVGAGTSDQTFTAGATGGESTHQLTTTEMPSHSHGASTDAQGGHDHGFTQDMVSTSGSGSARAGSASGQQLRWSSGARTDGAGNHGHNVFISNTGGDGAHNNLQPYIVVNIWKRTA